MERHTGQFSMLTVGHPVDVRMCYLPSRSLDALMITFCVQDRVNGMLQHVAMMPLHALLELQIVLT